MAENVNGQRHDRSALILYGSETGNSQEVAEELGRVAERLHFMTRVTEMDSIELVCQSRLKDMPCRVLICNRDFSCDLPLSSL
jgi:sulfite reductase alpha subunit-like flavoprotein